MKNTVKTKRSWAKPNVQVLTIKKDTFSGTIVGKEGGGADKQFTNAKDPY